MVQCCIGLDDIDKAQSYTENIKKYNNTYVLKDSKKITFFELSKDAIETYKKISNEKSNLTMFKLFCRIGDHSKKYLECEYCGTQNANFSKFENLNLENISDGSKDTKGLEKLAINFKLKDYSTLKKMPIFLNSHQLHG